MTGKLELRLLGGCHIAYAGKALAELTLNKARALLVYLAVTNRAHSRAHLIDLLWTELPEHDARRNLRVVLTKLRQSIGDQMTATRSHVKLNLDTQWRVDVTDFVAAEKVLHKVEHPWSDATVAILTDAFTAYQGDFLDGLEVPHAAGFEEWMLLERERLRQLAFLYGEALVRHYETTGMEDNAVKLCRQLLAIEPWHEAIHRRLMQLLVRIGQPTAALQQYERCRRLLATELAVEPEAATQALYERIRREAASLTESPSDRPVDRRWAGRSFPWRAVLPLPSTPFLGRSVELTQLIERLADPACRLLSLIGPGGIGKTRLALGVAQRLAEQLPGERGPGAPMRFVDGLYFVAAASLPTFDELISAVATVMGITFAGQDAPEAQLLNQLASQRFLLIIDNFEQMTPAAARLQRWLAELPGLVLLVTSRERLNLSDEWLFPVAGLPLPLPTDADEALTNNEAVQLFVQRAQRVNLGFALPAQATAERTALIAICRLLEGMPLALELAAAWTRTHSCVEILLEIRANVDFLASDLRDIPARHRSLRATFDHSWRLLDPADALILRQLVLLPAGFRATFARRVAQATPAALMRLVDKSLLQRSPGGRYTMHELLRQYVIQQLDPAEHDAILRYVRAYVPWVRELRNACECADEPQALDTFADEFENLRIAWQWLIRGLPPPGEKIGDRERHLYSESIGALQTYLPMITYFYLRRSRYREGMVFLTETLTQLEDGGWSTKGIDPTASEDLHARQTLCFLAQLAVALADIRFHLSEFATVVEMVESGLPILRVFGDTQNMANALTILGKAQIRMGRYEEAEQTLQEGLDAYRAIGKRKESSAVINALGILYSNQGLFAKATTYYETYLALAREAGYQRGIANALNNLGSNYARNGEYERAIPLYQESYEMAQLLGEELMLAVALSNLGSAARAVGRFADAQQYYEKSLIHCRAMGERRWTAAGLNGLGLTLLDSGAPDASLPHFVEALQIAQTIQSTPDLLDALAGIVLTQVGETVDHSTLILLAFVANHAVTQTLSRQRCAEMLQQLAHSVPITIYEEALTTAATLTIVEATARLSTLIH